METKKIITKKLSLLFILVIFNFSLFAQTYPNSTAVPCTLAVKEQVLIKHIQIFPNPVINSFQINYNEDYLSLPLTFTISDLSGKEIIIGNYTKNESIDVSCLKSGFYFFKALDKEKKIYLYKFLKQ
ncbi:MAG: T9SS type A sorting domain-containing protein [Bacteroidetes bacterium]|nr:T9SS type A sorting domain-containing protein [Bacteroidota bacterium]